MALSTSKNYSKTVLNKSAIDEMVDKFTPEPATKVAVEAGTDEHMKIMLRAYENLAVDLQQCDTLTAVQFDLKIALAYAQAVEAVQGRNTTIFTHFYTPDELAALRARTPE